MARLSPIESLWREESGIPKQLDRDVEFSEWCLENPLAVGIDGLGVDQSVGLVHSKEEAIADSRQFWLIRFLRTWRITPVPTTTCENHEEPSL